MATVRIQLRRGEYQDWYDANPQLAAGEVAIETDTNRIKFGDGNTLWRNLDYAIVNNDGTPLTTEDYGQPDGVPQLDGSGYIKAVNLPPLAKITVHSVANQAARLALTVEPGDIAIQSDNGTSYVLQSSPASTNANWKELTATQAINDAVNAAVTAMLDGAPGALNTLNELAAAIGDDPAFFTTVATLTGTQTLTNKTLTSPVINTPTGIVKADVGLGNVDNTSDADKPVSTAQAAADTAVANAASSALSSHASDTTDIHGIANTANLVTIDGSQLLSNKTINSPTVTGNLVLEGTTDNDYELTLTTEPTADRTITFPDNSGTVALVSNLNSYAELSGATFTGAVSGTDLTLSGNLTVNGTTTNLNTTNLNVEDKNITLGDTTSPSDATADGGGFSLKGSTDKSFTWLDATDSWTSSENIDLQSGKTYKIDGNIVLSGSQVLGKSVPSGTIVGTSDAQTLTGKTIDLTDNTISGTLAEFNSAVSDADLVSLTGVETLTNKTLQSPAISSPTGILKGDVGLGDVDNTSDLNKPVSTATQSALDLKANLASPTFTGTVVLPSTTSIGNVSSSEIETLDGINSNVQTQIDAKAPSASPTFTGTVVLPNTTSIGNVSSSEIETLDGVTSAIQTQLNAKLESATAASTYAPIASPTFTGTVSGVTKAMVGLANVDNTADTAKPVSTATQSALDLKADLAGPTFTGTVTLPGTTSIGDVSATEIGYVNGVTSAIQTQLDAKYSSASASTDLGLKANLASPTFTGTVVLPTVTAGGSIVPSTDNTYDLGSPTKMWKDLYVGPGSLYVNGQKVLQDESGNIVVSADANENLSLRTSGSGNVELDATGTGNIQIKSAMVIEAGSNITSSDGNGIAFGNAINTDTISSRTANTDLSLSANGTGKVYLNDNAEVNGNLVVGGNLTVSGTTTTVNSETISLADNIIDLNSNFTTGSPSENAGIRIMRGDSSPVQVRWNESTDKWEFTNDGSTYNEIAPIASPTFTGTVSGITATMVGLGNVNNTSDANKPVSTATQTALDLKAPLASPTFTGTVTVAASGIAFTDGTQTKEGVPSRTTINSATAAYNLSTGGLALRDTLIECNSASAFTVTIPANSTTAYPIGTSIDLLQVGAGQVTVAGAAGVTLNGTPGLKLRTQWSSATLFKRATDTWVIMGDLTA